jgi:hypothetical protein
MQGLHRFHLLLSHLSLSCLTFLGQSRAMTQDNIPVDGMTLCLSISKDTETLRMEDVQ